MSQAVVYFQQLIRQQRPRLQTLRQYRVAGLTLEISCSSRQLDALMHHALAHLSDATPLGQKHFEILAIEDEALFAEIHSRESIFEDSGIRCLNVPESGMVHLLQLETGQAITILKRSQGLPEDEIGSPFRPVLARFLRENGWIALHAGAVSLGDSAVLVTGTGGKGKSSTVLACMLHPDLGYLGDDFVAVRCGAMRDVCSLYNTAKISHDMQPMMPHLDCYKNELRPVTPRKSMAFLMTHHGQQLAEMARLRAIVVPETAGRRDLSMERISAAETLRHIAPSSLFLVGTRQKEDFQEIAELSRQIPCFRLHVSTDMRALAARIGGFLKAGCGS